jgi:hypothetical protein
MAPRGSTNPLSCLPEAFKSWSDGWTEVSDPKKPFNVVLEEDFLDKNLGQKFVSTLSQLRNCWS